jgi:ribosomal-protein-alanine N-acetyltransferase
MHPADIDIQPLAGANIPACVQVMLENPLWQKYGATAEGAQKMFEAALAAGAQILTARVSGQVAGFAWVAPRGAWDRSAYLRLIGVLPAFQGRHIGRTLLQAVEKLAAETAEDMFLLVTDSNISAQRFYTRAGYRQVGAIPDYVVQGITELIFYKRLKPQTGSI